MSSRKRSTPKVSSDSEPTYSWPDSEELVSEIAQPVAVYDASQIGAFADFQIEDEGLIQLVHDTIEATKSGLQRAQEAVDRIDRKLERAARPAG